MGLLNKKQKIVIERINNNECELETSKGMLASDMIAILLCSLAQICIVAANQASVPLEKVQKSVHFWFDEYIKKQMSKEEQ